MRSTDSRRARNSASLTIAADAGDLWLTPRGIVPGVELLASTIHYARLLPDDGLAATARQRRREALAVWARENEVGDLLDEEFV